MELTESMGNAFILLRTCEQAGLVNWAVVSGDLRRKSQHDPWVPKKVKLWEACSPLHGVSSDMMSLQPNSRRRGFWSCSGISGGESSPGNTASGAHGYVTPQSPLLSQKSKEPSLKGSSHHWFQLTRVCEGSFRYWLETQAVEKTDVLTAAAWCKEAKTCWLNSTVWLTLLCYFIIALLTHVSLCETHRIV